MQKCSQHIKYENFVYILYEYFIYVPLNEKKEKQSSKNENWQKNKNNGISNKICTHVQSKYVTVTTWREFKEWFWIADIYIWKLHTQQYKKEIKGENIKKQKCEWFNMYVFEFGIVYCLLYARVIQT